MHWPLHAAFADISRAGVTRIVCLEEREKLLERSPGYFGALERGEAPAPVRWHPVTDFGVPEDVDAYRALVREVAAAVRDGEAVLVHCAGGCGRAGTFAALVLVALGTDPADAEEVFRRARGCGPESPVQRELVRRGL